MSCPYCKAPVAEGATKCAACGEWLDGKRHDGDLHPWVKVAAVVAMVFLAYLFVANYKW